MLFQVLTRLLPSCGLIKPTWLSLAPLYIETMRKKIKNEILPNQFCRLKLAAYFKANQISMVTI